MPCIDTPRTDEGAFAAKHAFIYILSDNIVFSPFDKYIQLPETEFCKISRGAGSGASAAFDAKSESGLFLKNVISYAPVVGIIVDLTAF